MGRSERLIKPGDSWFSPKCIEVQPRMISVGGRALKGLGPARVPNPIKLRIPMSVILGVRRREISFIVERERAQTTG